MSGDDWTEEDRLQEAKAIRRMERDWEPSREPGSERALRLVTTDLTTELPPPAHVIDRLVPRGVVTLLGAHGGAGKSVLALTLAAHVATGRTWAGLGIDQGHAVFCSLEDPGALVNFRLRRIAEAYGLDPDTIAANLSILDGSDADAALAGEQREEGVNRLTFTAASQDLWQLASGSSLIVVDNASDAADFNENDRRLVRRFVRMLAQMARENDAGLILLAHIDKAAARSGSSGNTYSGSTAWHNSARSRIALLDTDGNIELRQEKANLGRPADPIRLHWSEHGVLMPMGSAHAFAQTRDDADAVLAALKAAWAAGVDVSAARTGPTTTQAVLGTFDEMPRHLRGPAGRSAFWSALGKLQNAGKVQQAEILTGQRKRKTVLVDPVCASSEGRESARANPPHPLCAYSAHEGARVCAGSAPIQAEELAQIGAAEYRAAKNGEPTG
jgi:hypothetical protein